MAKVFISHSWKDNDISRKIAHELRKDGAKIWIDYARIKAGDTLPERISNALEWCDTLVLVWSKAAAASYWVKKEWQSALTLQKEIIPCIIDDTPLPAILCSFVYINFKNFSQGYEELLRALDLDRIIPPIPMHDPPIPIPFKKKIPTKQLMKIAAIFMAILILGFSANYVVQKIAADREAKKAYWEKRQSEMTTRFEQSQQSDNDTKKSASDKIQVWQQFAHDFAANNPFSKDDDRQLSQAVNRMNKLRNEVTQDSLKAAEQSSWNNRQREMNSSYQQALRRDNLSSLEAADKAQMWQDFLDQYAQDNPFSQEDNDQLVKATKQKDFWLTQIEQEAEQARWEQRQTDMTKSYNEAKQREQNNNLSPDAKAKTWQNFLNSYAADIPNSQQDNNQRKYAEQRKKYWTDYQPPQQTIVTPPTEKIVKGMTLVLIRGGTFDMGDTFGDGAADEKPVHSVTVSNFYMGRTEVTNAQFCQFLNEKENQTEGGVTWLEFDSEYCLITKQGGNFVPKNGYANHPVIEVSWYGARAFANWAGCRLPYEAEWEFAARNGGKKVKYPNGDNLTHDDANFSGIGGKDKWDRTSPVASFPSNELGLYDMSGNVWEWCADWYDENYYKNSPQNNPKGPTSSPIGARVLRGGSWIDDERGCRSTNRNWFNPVSRIYYWGFRVVQDSPH